MRGDPYDEGRVGGGEKVTLTLFQILFWAILAFPGAGARADAIPGTNPAAQKEGRRSPHGNLQVPCENCHTSAGWKPIRAIPEFDHNKTKYPLRGMHEKVACIACHTKPVFTNVGKNCADCHSDVHRRQLGSNCAQCHSVNGWMVSTQQIRDHQNRFPLFGAHAAVQCDSCHKQAATGMFLGLSTQCDSCHLSDWQKTTNPAHATAGPAFASANCQGCHGFDTWLTSTFNHSSTGFPLTAGHSNVPCAECHIQNNYNLQTAPTDCGNSGCHLTTWQQTNNPPHVNAGSAFAVTNCSTCHNTTSWSTAIFNHNLTGWPLTGAHATTACTACHVNNNYNFTSANTDCYGCHQKDWTSTQTTGGNVPNHVAAGFPTALCSTCHDTVNWADGKFDHTSTGWALTGAHTTTPCASCHVSNNYSLTSANTVCYGCHLSAWQSTQTAGGSVPNHIAAGYPTTCDSCHVTSSWSGATFNHAYFPLPHHGSICNDCHQVSTDYSSFTCINCHTVGGAHNQATTDPKHDGVGGYSYGPTTCYNCHKNGGAG